MKTLTQEEVSLMMYNARQDRELVQLRADNLVLRLALEHYQAAVLR